jgi:ATP-dependent DNA helicase RecQ
MQLDIIQSVGEGRDTLGLLPTGGGKSLTFQVPALAQPGICLVVTPLIALMKDQVEQLNRKGIKAYAIHSGLNYGEIERAYDNCIFGDYKFMYLSPERLSTSMFLEKLPHLKVNLLAIDEAHCISQWGYDFRPSYLKIAEVREHLPGVPVLALTATATPEVVEDIQTQLKFPKRNVFQKSFERSNLAYVVRRSEDKEKQLLKILDGVPGSAVVYVRNRKKTKEYAELIQNHGIGADFFHAGLPQKVKDARQASWMLGDCRVIVSTNAFGMGIDKADVRMVVHMDSPNSLEAYFQEAGRAGRDEKKAFAVLLWSPQDKAQLTRSISTTFPEVDVIRRVYDALGNFFQLAVGFGEHQVLDFNIGRFCAAFGFNVLTLVSSLKILQRAGYLYFTEMADIPSTVMMLMNDYELYKFQVANARLDPFIKVLLRSYTGLFTDYASIDEDLLAKRLNVSRDEVYQAFLQLSRLKVLHYNPQRRTPLITYLQHRFEPRHLKFPPEVYKDRLEQYKDRVESVIDYATTVHVCRSRLLLRYFGEKSSANCGHCDVCLERKKSRLSDEEFNLIETALRNELLKSPQYADDLVNSLTFTTEKVWKVLRWLEEADVVAENEEGLLEWLVKN